MRLTVNPALHYDADQLKEYADILNELTEYYGDGASAVFEGMEVKVPSMTDEYLTHKYGDWRAELPEDAKVSHHTTEICDTTVSYKKYIDF